MRVINDGLRLHAWCSVSGSDFGFAFNDSKFSDRLLRIEIMGGPSDSLPTVRVAPASPIGPAVARGAERISRRKMIQCSMHIHALDLSLCPEEQVLVDNQPGTNDHLGCENQDEETVAMVEETQSGDEDANSSMVLRVKTLHISSPILAAKSPFFFKLFSNGMRESEPRHVTIRISAFGSCRHGTFEFMYTNTLSSTRAPALLDVLMAADKFESQLCSIWIFHRVLMGEAVQPLIDAAKLYLACRYKDITKFQEEVMALPLAGIEAICPVMICKLLLKMLCITSFEVGQGSVSKTGRAKGGPLFKAEAPHRQRSLAAESATLNRRFTERAYKYQPVRVVEFEPCQQCVVYLDLKREECAQLFPVSTLHHGRADLDPLLRVIFRNAGKGFN
ncbi:Detected protein of confused Function [Hibiscus syriacus]|uniref:Detected protein of confused Function n=1 Tax=Hibiscus syriacus TaxID=106335 RepID=A0A6A3A9C5_HIBSY|nr:Detected protein of confused Function [Hibiscus syriacus]